MIVLRQPIYHLRVAVTSCFRMGSTAQPSVSITDALEAARAQYGKENLKSGELWKKTTIGLPGGTTRSGLFYPPHPLVFVKGEGAYLTDADGFKYLDLCGEFSAGMFGHTNSVLQKAVIESILDGTALGGINKYEGRAAELICSRFPSMHKVRFANSGMEANMTAIALARVYTGRKTVIVFKGGYHGGMCTFADLRYTAQSMNLPFDWLILPYNDIPSFEGAVDEHKDDLACILLEPMQGASGCIAADIGFLQTLRRRATETGAVLMFDEVMTGRLSVGGLQGRVGVTPDLTSIGKFFGGGGQNFAAFGGKKEIMELFEPGHPKNVYQSGTYNNNVSTMAATVAVMEQLWTPEEAERLFELGEWLRTELNKLSEAADSSMQVCGIGSLMNIHFTRTKIRSAADVQSGNIELRKKFFFDMLRKGFWVVERGFICLMTVHTKEQLQSFLDATKVWLELEENKQYQ